MIIIEYLKYCFNSLWMFLIIFIVGFIITIYRKEDIKIYIIGALFLSIFYISDFLFYTEYLISPIQKTHVTIEKVEKETLLPNSDLLYTKSRHRNYFKVFIVRTNNKNEYLLADTNWENAFNNGYPITGEFEIEYKETRRYDIITNIKKID